VSSEYAAFTLFLGFEIGWRPRGLFSSGEGGPGHILIAGQLSVAGEPVGVHYKLFLEI